jgi:hypothetical protein
VTAGKLLELLKGIEPDTRIYIEEDTISTRTAIIVSDAEYDAENNMFFIKYKDWRV